MTRLSRLLVATIVTPAPDGCNIAAHEHTHGNAERKDSIGTSLRAQAWLALAEHRDGVSLTTMREAVRRELAREPGRGHAAQALATR